MEENINQQMVKIETQAENSPDEINIEENIVIDDNTEILAINNDSNIQLEFFDVKNLTQDDQMLRDSNSIEVENECLKKELTLIQEKFSILQSQVQHQAKLIELLLRLDMVKSDENPDKREIEDLQRKIHLCTNLIEECNIKYGELCNEKRRVLIVTGNEPAYLKVEKKAAIWDHFTVLSNNDGQKNIECNYCGKTFNHRSMNAYKCREHIYEKCEKAPEEVKTTHKPRYETYSGSKSKFNVWNYFQDSYKDGKGILVCAFCKIEYSSRNATKCREHLAFKCTQISPDIKSQMKSTFSQEYINSINTNRKSSIWEHFSVIEEDGQKSIIQCIYCCMNYANKNATKCREHLLERCDKIPLNIRHKINNSFFESPLKTWTQIKIPIWNHFSIIVDNDRKHYKCNYCSKPYSSKNVTKFRLHLLYKCEQIPKNIKSYINMEISKSGHKGESTSEDADFYADEQFLSESNHSIENDGDGQDDDDDGDEVDDVDGQETSEQQQNNNNEDDGKIPSAKRLKVELTDEDE